MECIDAQALISAALDREPVTREELRAAKAHCTGCQDCRVFVHSLGATIRAGLPTPPDGLADRMVATVIGEAARPTEKRPEPVMVDPLPVDSEERFHLAWSDPQTRRWLISLGAVAAVVVVVAGAVANQGVRAILTPSSPESLPLDTQTTSWVAPPSTGSAATGNANAGASGAAGTEEAPVTVGTSHDYIEVGGVAYVSAGPASGVDAASLRTIGVTRTSMDSDGRASSVDVLGDEDAARVYLETEDGDLIAFDRVTREYDGIRYELRTASIEHFSSWPTLPDDVKRPTSPDGSPSFSAVDEGVGTGTVFEPVSRPDSGIAIAPNSGAADAAAGNPDWTWWTPIP